MMRLLAVDYETTPIDYTEGCDNGVSIGELQPADCSLGLTVEPLLLVWAYREQGELRAKGQWLEGEQGLTITDLVSDDDLVVFANAPFDIAVEARRLNRQNPAAPEWEGRVFDILLHARWAMFVQFVQRALLGEHVRLIQNRKTAAAQFIKSKYPNVSQVATLLSSGVLMMYGANLKGMARGTLGVAPRVWSETLEGDDLLQYALDDAKNTLLLAETIISGNPITVQYKSGRTATFQSYSKVGAGNGYWTAFMNQVQPFSVAGHLVEGEELTEFARLFYVAHRDFWRYVNESRKGG